MKQQQFHLTLMDGKSVDETASTVIGPAYMGQVQEWTIYVVFDQDTTSGVVTIEAAHRADFGGTWHSLSTVTWAVANSVQLVSVTGVHQAVRARISTVIGGGTVDVFAVGN